MIVTQGVPKSNLSNRYKVAGNATNIGTVWYQIAGVNPARQKISIYNGSASASATGVFYIAFGAKPADISAGAPVDYTLALRPGDLYEDWNSIDAVYTVVLTSGTSTDLLFVTEMM